MREYTKEEMIAWVTKQVEHKGHILNFAELNVNKIPNKEDMKIWRESIAELKEDVDIAMAIVEMLEEV